MLQHHDRWKLIFNGEDWSKRRGIYYANESEGVVGRYAMNEKDEYITKDEAVVEKPLEKGRVRILEIGSEIDSVENIWNINREED